MRAAKSVLLLGLFQPPPLDELTLICPHKISVRLEKTQGPHQQDTPLSIRYVMRGCMMCDGIHPPLHPRHNERIEACLYDPKIATLLNDESLIPQAA